jgi:hypothetical protein
MHWKEARIGFRAVRFTQTAPPSRLSRRTDSLLSGKKTAARNYRFGRWEIIAGK